MSPRDGAFELTAHQRLRLLTSAAIVLEAVVIIHHDWIELRLLDTTIHQRWVVDPYLTTVSHAPSFRAQPPRIVGPTAMEIAERFLPAVIEAIEAEVADHLERATWSYDDRPEGALRVYHEDFAHELRQRLADLFAKPDGPAFNRSDGNPGHLFAASTRPFEKVLRRAIEPGLPSASPSIDVAESISVGRSLANISFKRLRLTDPRSVRDRCGTSRRNLRSSPFRSARGRTE